MPISFLYSLNVFSKASCDKSKSTEKGVLLNLFKLSFIIAMARWSDGCFFLIRRSDASILAEQLQILF